MIPLTWRYYPLCLVHVQYVFLEKSPVWLGGQVVLIQTNYSAQNTLLECKRFGNYTTAYISAI